MRDLLYGILLVGGITACVCVAAPEPAILPEPGDWTVDLTFEHPQQITLGFDINGQPRRYWYTIVTVTNNEGRDVDFYPKCELMTDTFQIVPAGKGVSPAVFERIKDRHKSQYPFLEPLEKIGNKILEGEDNARDIAIIWPDFDARAGGMKIFLTGLSNETAVIDHPIAKDEAGNPVKVYLRKTLELNYGLRGDTRLRSYMKVDYKDKRWVMR
ncbi:MAG: hypothetical protein JSV16_11630 [Candidatus Hydrogenedentota bacterium]|nr:MAG: hypothetical protein JSV16_11630 [Candidatus Hydrogenedentota bacterium]